MESFPAVVIGGPPHSGKSVLTYSLTQALRARAVDHYVLRACPDGEGDWANEADQALVRQIRVKGPWTDEWIDLMCRDLARRHLPLIVDIGGMPTKDQERILDYCTHAVLLTPDEAARQRWQEYMDEHAVAVIADLDSVLEGNNALAGSSPVITGTLAGLERGTSATGPAFEALVDRLAELFAFDRSQLRRDHLAAAPVELAIDLDRLARSLDAIGEDGRVVWRPEHLPQVLNYLPIAVPLALYGRGPNWLYAALARLAYPAACHQFDVRLGWVRAQALRLDSKAPRDTPVQFQLAREPDFVLVAGHLPSAYVDYSELRSLVVPPTPVGVGVILSGKLPQWLFTSLAVTYVDAAWLAVYQPILDGAVVVYAESGDPAVGSIIPVS